MYLWILIKILDGGKNRKQKQKKHAYFELLEILY